MRIFDFRTILILTGLAAGWCGARLGAQTVYTPLDFTTWAGPSAQLASPLGVAVDSAGHVYVADSGNDVIREFSSGGAGTIIAGSAGVAGHADGPGAAALFDLPSGIAVDSAGDIYVADTLNNAIRELTPTILGGTTNWTVSTLEIGVTGESADNGSFSPMGVAVDTAGHLFFTISVNTRGRTPGNVIEEYAGGAVTLIAGSPGKSGDLNGIGAAATFGGLSGIAVDTQGTLYVADIGHSTVRQITPTAGSLGTQWVVTTLAGIAGMGGSVDGSPSLFNQPYGIAVDSAGNVYVSDQTSNTIRIIAPSRLATTAAGVPGFAGLANGAGASALFSQPAGLAVDAAGDVFVADSGNNVIRKGTAAFGTPAFTEVASPSAVTIASGHSVAFNAIATGSPAPGYQWTLNGSTTIPGASNTTDPVLLISGATTADTGTLTCTAANTVGTATTSASLSVITTSTPGYLINLSARADVLTGNNLLIVGLGVTGGGTEPMLIRGDGPSVVNVASSLAGQLLPNPALTLFDNHSIAIVSNTGWGNALVAGTSPDVSSPVLATAGLFTDVGAFNFLSATSTDSALEFTAASHGYTAEVIDANGATGIALAEIYDAGSGTSARLDNLSARADIGTGGNILIGGFNISGSTSETVLVRGDGPAMGAPPFNLPGFLTQPTISIYSGSTVIYTNTGWGNDPVINTTFNPLGAFSLATNSADCALLVTLPPGGYTVLLSGANGTTGIGLVEIYEVF